MSSAFVPLYQLFVRSLLSRGKVIGVGILDLNMIALAFVLRDTADSGPEQVLGASEFIQSFGMSLLAPFVALLFGAAVLGDHVENGSLIYLWMRPTSRLSVVGTAYLAVVSVVLPFVLVPVMITAALSGDIAQVLPGALVAVGLGVLAYSALFVVFGLWTKHALLIGLGYVLIWEATVASLSKGAALFSIRGHMEVVFAGISDVPIDAPSISLGASLFALLAVPVVSLAIGRRIFATIEVP